MCFLQGAELTVCNIKISVANITRVKGGPFLLADIPKHPHCGLYLQSLLAFWSWFLINKFSHSEEHQVSESYIL